MINFEEDDEKDTFVPQTKETRQQIKSKKGIEESTVMMDASATDQSLLPQA